MKKLTSMILLENLIDKRGRKYDLAEIMSQTFGKTFYGELLGDDLDLVVNLNRVTHKVDNIAIVNNNLVGDITILDTSMGKILHLFLSNGLRVTSSIRAIGEVNSNGVTNLSITTFDLDIDR